MNNDQLIFIGLCALGPAVQNVGLGMQKLGIDRLPRAPRGARMKWGIAWTLGTLLVVGAVFIGFRALTFGFPSTLGGFTGVGLIVLTLFSYFILREKILPMEYLGIAVIIAGTWALGRFGSAVAPAEARVTAGGSAAFFAAYGAAAAGALLLFRNYRSFGGVILGCMAGSLAGMSLVFQKVVTPLFNALNVHEWRTVSAFLACPDTWVTALFGIGGFVLLQIGYKFGKAVQVVPAYDATLILTPAIAGIALLGDAIAPVAWISYFVVVLGVVIITTAAPMKHR